MRVLLHNHHTPYLSNLARALPEVDFLAMPTGHALTGWRDDQRPKPGNVTLWAASSGARVSADVADVVMAQTASDLRILFMDSDWRSVRDGPVLFLAHNRAEFDWPSGLFRERQAGHVRVVAISRMKADSYRWAGYDRPITVIAPGVALEEYGPWRGDVPRVLTVANHLRRPLFDLDAWLAATKGLRVTLVGEGNEGLPGAIGPARDFDALREYYRSHQVYLGVNKWPCEDPHNLALLEAMATNMPVVYLNGYPDRLTTAKQLRERCLGFLRDARADTSRPWNLGWHRYLADQFSFERFAASWRSVLSEVCCG